MKFFKSIVLTLFVALLFPSCSGVAKDVIFKEVEKTNAQLPITLTEGCSFDSTAVDDNYLVFYYSISHAMQDLKVGLNLNDEAILARIISTQSRLFGTVAVANMGFKAVYLSADSGKLVKEEIVEPDMLKKVYEKYLKGDVKAASFVELIENELSKTQSTLPVQISENLYLTKCFVSDYKEIHYEYMIDVEATREELEVSDDDIEEERLEVIKSLEEDMTFKVNKNDVKRDISKFVYVYTNSNGELLYSYSILTSEMWNN